MRVYRGLSALSVYDENRHFRCARFHFPNRLHISFNQVSDFSRLFPTRRIAIEPNPGVSWRRAWQLVFRIESVNRIFLFWRQFLVPVFEDMKMWERSTKRHLVFPCNFDQFTNHETATCHLSVRVAWWVQNWSAYVRSYLNAICFSCCEVSESIHSMT